MKFKKDIQFSESLKRVENTYWTDKLIQATDSIIDNFNRINISSSEWKRMNKRHGQSAIKRLISRAIIAHKIPMPLQPISEEFARKAFRKLKSFRSDTGIMFGKVFSRFDYKWPISPIYISANSSYNPASNYFQQYNRWLAGSAKHISPYDAWHKYKHHNTFLNNLWSLDRPKVTTGILNSAINLKLYVATQFKPQAAKIFYEMFNAKHILDLSSGWGDRLCGFCASNAKSYVGLDPNTRLIAGYQKQIEMFGKDKDIEMVCTGSEFYKPGKKKFDTIFTSPPYFAIEEYSDDAGQSFKQYNTFDKWCFDFLFPTLDMAWDALDTSQKGRGGILCINISDVMIGTTRHHICDRMNDYLSKKKGANYVGCIGLRLSLRPNITNEDHEDDKKDAAFIEPMWIWSKNGDWSIDDYIDHGFKKKKIVGLFN